MRQLVSVAFGRNTFCLRERHIFVSVGRWQLLVALGAVFELERWRTLPNGDSIPWSESLPPPDDWRMSPCRKGGTAW